MTGKLIELPRRLEWKSIEYWHGTVSGTGLKASVMPMDKSEEFAWATWNNGLLVKMGISASMEEAKEAARLALEKNVLVLRPLPTEGA